MMGNDDLTAEQRARLRVAALASLYQGGDYSGRLGRRPPKASDFAVGFAGFLILATIAYWAPVLLEGIE